MRTSGTGIGVMGHAVIMLFFAVLIHHQYSVVADTRLHRRDEITGHIPSTHEEIVSRREEHHEIFTSRLNDVNLKLNRHASGEELLTESEFKRLNRKKNAFEHKLNELSREFDSRHSRRIMDREELLDGLTKSRLDGEL